MNHSDTMIKNVMDNFISSYAARDKSIDFSEWLAKRLQQEMPDMPSDAGERLSKEIIEAVASYDRTLGELNSAVGAGQSKEEWLADRAIEACTDIPINEASGTLVQIENSLNKSNTQLMQNIVEFPGDTLSIVNPESTEWNKYSLKSKALDIGKQSVMSGLNVAANIVKMNRESDIPVDVGDTLKLALHEGIETAKGEVKAVVAGAVRTVAEKGLSEHLPADTSVDTIADIAGVAVEGAVALMDVATGKTSMTEALEKTTRAGVAAVGRWGAEALRGKLLCIPIVGPLVVEFAGGLLDHLTSEKFTENMYTVVHDAAVATWEGIKQAGQNLWNKITNKSTEQQYN